MSTLRNKNLAQAVRECGSPPCAMAFELDADECVCVCRMDQEVANPVGKGRRGARSKGMKFPRRRKGQTWQQYHDQLAGLAAKSLKDGRTAESYGYQVAAKMVAKRHHDDVMASRPAGYRAAGPGTLSWDDCMESVRRKHPTWSDERCRKVCGAIRARSKRAYPAYWGTSAKRNPSSDQVDHALHASDALRAGLNHLLIATRAGEWTFPVVLPAAYQHILHEDQGDGTRGRDIDLALSEIAETLVVMSACIGHVRQIKKSERTKRINDELMVAEDIRDWCEGKLRAAASSKHRKSVARHNPRERQHSQDERKRWERFTMNLVRAGDYVNKHFGGRVPSVREGLADIDAYLGLLQLIGTIEASDPTPVEGGSYSFHFFPEGRADNVYYTYANEGSASDDNSADVEWDVAERDYRSGFEYPESVSAHAEALGILSRFLDDLGKTPPEEQNPRKRKTATRNPSPPQHERIGEEALTQGIANLRVALAFSGKNLHLDVPSKFVVSIDKDVDEIDSRVRGHVDENKIRILAVTFKLLMGLVQIAVAENSFKMASPRKPSKNQQLSGKALRIAAEEMRALSTRFRPGGEDKGVTNPSERQHEQNKERLEHFIGDLVDRAFHGQMPDVYAGMRSVDSYIAYLCLAGALVANDVGPDFAENEAFIPEFVLRPPEGNIYARTIAQPASYLHASVAPRKKKDPKQWNPAARGLHAAGGGHRPRAAGNQPRYRCTTLDRKGHRTAAWETTLEESRGSLSKLGLDDLSVNQMTCIALRDGGMLYVRRIA